MNLPISDVRHTPASSDSGSLDQYRRLIENLTNHAIISLSVDGRIAIWNSGAKQTFGYDEHEVLGQHFSLLFCPEDIAGGRPAFELRAALESGESSIDGWMVRKDGSRFWANDLVQPSRDARGHVSGFTKIVQDATEHHVSAERLRESEERLRLLIESVTDYAIFSIAGDGTIQLWNTGAEHIFGYTEADVLGKHFSLIYTPEAIARGVPDAEIALAGKDGHAPDEGWHVRRDGEVFYASGHLTRLKPDAAGRPRGFVKIAHDITTRNEDHQKMQRKAFHDELTGLPNRAFFSDYLRRSIATSKRYPAKRFAVIFIDLDRFKIINDSLGHVLADGLLVHVAQALEHCVRPEDVVARLGGDEFTILLSDVRNAGEAVHVAERIHEVLASPYELEGFEVFTSASMGIAIGASTYDKPEQILRDADTAMYEAKAQGRSRHVVFDSAMHSRAVGLLNLQMDLRRSIAGSDFFIEYQPIVALEGCRVVGFEALVRWNHPERGVIGPGEFIAEAESMGLIVHIDNWVLHEACRQIRNWQIECGDDTLTVSVNVSSKQFAHEGLVSEILDALEVNGLAPRSLKLEITETVLMGQSEVVAATIGRIGELGVEMYIDDFGNGYSSLSYLSRLPLKLLKVDRSFVKEISSNARSAVIVGTVVTLAHNLGLGALAEGIETEEQCAKLKAMGCEFGQGYWLSRPVEPNLAQTLIGQTLPRSIPVTTA